MGILSGINKRAELGAGGVRYALIAELKDVNIEFTDGDGNTPSTAKFTLAAGTAITPATTPFHKYAFTVETSSSDSVLTGAPSAGSSVQAHTVNMTFHKRNAALRNEIQALAIKETIVVMVDCNGYAELLGGQCGEGLYGTAGSNSSGVAKGDLNGNVITLTANQAKMPYTVEAAQLALIDEDNA